MKGQQPAWMKEESSEPLNAGNVVSSSGEAGTGDSKKNTLFFWFLRIVTMGLCALMCATAVLGLLSMDGVDAVGKAFVGVYMLFFSVLLFLFELIQIRPCEALDHMFKRNFGFLYSTKGKAFYIIFIAFLSFGLGEPQTMSFATGSLLAIFGIFELVFYLKYPDLFDEE